jgi:CxxC motif-containing protein (DUF1111 family)
MSREAKASFQANPTIPRPLKVLILLALPLLITSLTSGGTFNAPGRVILAIPPGLQEAPAGYDNVTNGFASQSDFDLDQTQFIEDADLPALGPNFNARSCADCHDTPVVGGGSQVTEHRVSPIVPGTSIVPATLIHDKSTNPETQQRAPRGAVNVLRLSLPLSGDGFVEGVPDEEFIAIAKQNGGQIVMVPVLESPGTKHVGRFGWKDQHASLLSFAADADFNEKGVSNRLVGDQGIEDDDNPAPGKPEDIDFYTEYMRALKAPSRGPVTASVTRGEAVFDHIGCATCHLDTLYTSKYKFHPYGDFLLHDIGTGDGTQQGDAPANKVRTMPLWGLRARSRFLHDASAFRPYDAVERHRREAEGARLRFNLLTTSDKQAVLSFLDSL